MNEQTETLIRDISSSLVVRFGTTAPYSIGPVTAERIGYADIPSIVTTVHCRDEDTSSLVPIVRARVFAELAERGWANTVVRVVPSVQRNRKRRFVDGNEDSPSFGKPKFGLEHRFSFEIVDTAFAAVVFEKRNRYAPLPDRRVA